MSCLSQIHDVLSCICERGDRFRNCRHGVKKKDNVEARMHKMGIVMLSAVYCSEATHCTNTADVQHFPTQVVYSELQ